MKKYLLLLKLEIISQLEYRGDAILYILREIVFGGIEIYVWIYLYNLGFAFEGYTRDSMVGYIIFAQVLKLFLSSSVFWFMESHIKDGLLANILTKPLSFFLYNFFTQIGARVRDTLFTLPFLTILVISGVLKFQNLSVATLGLFILACLTAFCLSYCLAFLFGCTAFWIERMDAFTYVYWYFVRLVRGEFVPLRILHPVFLSIAMALPFQLTLYFPLRILLEELDFTTILYQFALTFAWIGIALIATKFVLEMGYKKFESVGR